MKPLKNSSLTEQNLAYAYIDAKNMRSEPWEDRAETNLAYVEDARNDLGLEEAKRTREALMRGNRCRKS